LGKEIILFCIVFIEQELVALLVFHYVRRAFRKGKPPPDRRSVRGAIGRGILERFLIYLGLVTGLSQVLMLFGAIKLGTRLDADKNSMVSNQYFIVGTFLSVLLAMLGYLAYNWLATELFTAQP
jgi:hypothetical protein